MDIERHPKKGSRGQQTYAESVKSGKLGIVVLCFGFEFTRPAAKVVVVLRKMDDPGLPLLDNEDTELGKWPFDYMIYIARPPNSLGCGYNCGGRRSGHRKSGCRRRANLGYWRGGTHTWCSGGRGWRWWRWRLNHPARDTSVQQLNADYSNNITRWDSCSR